MPQTNAQIAAGKTAIVSPDGNRVVAVSKPGEVGQPISTAGRWWDEFDTIMALHYGRWVSFTPDTLPSTYH